MILDYDNELTSNQSATLQGQLVTATAIGGKVIDGGTSKDWGAGETLVPYFKVTGAAASNPTTSMTVSIETSDAVGITSSTVLSTVTVLAASLTAGSIHAMPPLKAGAKGRYLGCRFTPNGGSATTGALVVGFVDKDGRPQNGVNTL